jgi:hypothetical protein
VFTKVVKVDDVNFKAPEPITLNGAGVEAVWPSESIAKIVLGNEPDVVGAPKMTPLAFIFRPVGKPVAVKLMGDVPPVSITAQE